MHTSPLGIQYPDETDAVTLYPAVAQQLALWMDARPGIARLTTTQRNALVAPDLWQGKVIYNTTTLRVEVYDAGTGGWRGVTQALPMNDATRDALTGQELWLGRLIWNTSTNTLQVWDGAAWQANDRLPLLTTTQRNALAGDDLWVGKIVFDTTIGSVGAWDGTAWRLSSWYTSDLAANRPAAGNVGRHFIYTDATGLNVGRVDLDDGAAWRQIAGLRPKRERHTHLWSGVLAVPTGPTNYIPPFGVSLGTGETLQLLSVRMGIRAGTATLKAQRNGADIAGLTGLAVTTTPTVFVPTGAPITLADGDQLQPVVTAIGTTPDGLTVDWIFTRYA